MQFSYKAVDRSGKLISGIYNANDQKEVMAYLSAQGMTPVAIKEGGLAKELNIGVSRPPAAKHKAMFCDQFASLLESGVTIIDALEMLTKQTKQKVLKAGIAETVKRISAGESLGAAMGASPKAFDETLVSLVTAGEKSGSLEMSLKRMATKYENDAKVKAAVIKALIYPIFVLIISIIVVIVMLIKVVPSFMEMFDQMDMDMPALTLWVVAASEWMQKNYIILIAIIIAAAVAIAAFASSQTGKKVNSKLALVIPVVKNFSVKSNSANIARTLGTLLSAGMTTVEALQILENTTGNYYYRQSVSRIRTRVLAGRQISDEMVNEPKLYPDMLVHMMKVGENTGDLTSMLNKTAEYYEQETQTATDAIMSLIQPVIIVLLALIVGVLVAAVFGPMLTMYKELGAKLKS